MKTYKEAIKPPKQGYKYADQEQMQAMAAEQIGHKFCLNPVVVYNYGMKHRIRLESHLQRMMNSRQYFLDFNYKIISSI